MRPPRTFSAIHRIRQRLWSMARAHAGAALYAVVDCARTRRAFCIVDKAPLVHRCLYQSMMPHALMEAAPQLVLLDERRPYDIDLLAHGWGESWGIFLVAPPDFASVRRQLRRLLTVQNEAGRRLLFRFYDPRVLRVYLPTCSPDELHPFFGPIQEFIVESVDGREIVGLSEEGGALRVRAQRCDIDMDDPAVDGR